MKKTERLNHMGHFNLSDLMNKYNISNVHL